MEKSQFDLVEKINFFDSQNSKLQNMKRIKIMIVIIKPKLKADEGTWTPDLLITNQLLYQLSYISAPTLILFNILYIMSIPFQIAKNENINRLIILGL